MDKLKAEIELKRKSSHTAEAREGQPTKKKYMRKGDLAKLEAEQQKAEEKRKMEEASKKMADQAKQKRTTEGLKESSLHSKQQAHSGSATPNPLTEAENENQPELFNISNEEAVRRLRNKGQPIRLFGESDKERRLRLRALQLIEERTEGGRNELMQALEGVEGKMDLEVLPKHANDPKPNHPKSAIPGHLPEGSGHTSDGELEPNDDAEFTVDLNLIKTDPRKIYPQIYFALKVTLLPTQDEFVIKFI